MKRTISLILASSAALICASCDPGSDGNNTVNVVKPLEDLAKLNAVCVTGYKATVKPQVAGAATGSVDIQLTFTNPLPEQAKGSLVINMAVEAKGIVLGTPASNVSSSTKPGGYELPATTVYPGGVTDGFTSDVIITAPHDGRARYDIEAYINIPGLNYDGMTCHTFKAADLKL